MKNLILIIFILVCFVSNAQTDSSLTISEVMFRPNASNSEFIEIYNTSPTPVDLTGFRFSYHTSSDDNIIAHDNGTIIPGNGFAVILEGDYDFVSGIYAGLIPAEAIVLKLDNNAFGSSGMANSSDREIRLINSIGDTLEVYTYSANNNAGISDEKIELIKNNALANWSNSFSDNGTPGGENSVSPKQIDVGIVNINQFPSPAFEGSPINFNVGLTNNGQQNTTVFTVRLYEDLNQDSIATIDEEIDSRQVNPLVVGESTNINLVFFNPDNKTYNLIVKHDLAGDEVESNNIAYLEVSVAPKPNDPNDISINEIMYAPSSGQPEWVELINNTNNDINLKNWSIADNSSDIIISDSDIFIPALGYLVISDDDNIEDFYNFTAPLLIASLPSFNNGGDNVVLIDSLTRTIDSVGYSPTWGGTNGKSLERIRPVIGSNDSANWASAITILNATPGGLNSVFPKAFDLTINNVFTEPVIPIENDDVSINVIVKNIGTSNANQFSVNFFLDENSDSSGQPNELLSTQNFSNLDSEDSLLVEYVFTNVDLRKYDLLLEVNFANDQFNENNSAVFSFTVNERPADYNDLVINEIMYKPSTNEPEWVELFNRSNSEWNLKGWRFADRSSSSELTDEDLILQPDEFIVLSDDESLINFYEIPSNILVVNLPSLNNSDDGLKIIDNLQRVIDSVNYKSTWGGSSEGRSLERKLVDNPSNDSTNWGSADISSIATPGMVNSIVPKQFDLTITNVEIIEDYVLVGNTISVKTTIKNIGLEDVSQFSVSFTSVKSADLVLIDSEIIAGLTANDSTTFVLQTNLIEEGTNTWWIEINSNEDLNSNNNRFVLEFEAFEINELPGDIVINEIMHSPSSGEPEWIEIYNKSDKIINLQGFQIADNSDTSLVVNSEINLAQGRYFIFADDSSFIDKYPFLGNYIISSFPGLNNSGDDLKLINRINQVIDEVPYRSSWGGTNGRSLERISFDLPSDDSTNWSTTNLLSGGSPGIINTVAQKDIDAAVTGISFNPEQPLSGDNVRISAYVKNLGKTDAVFSLILFEDLDLDSLSNIIVERADNISLQAGDSTRIEFDYTLENIQKETGYLIFVELNNDQDNSNDFIYATISPGYQRASVVINEIHYTPTDGEPEWFELVNNSTQSINLKNWISKDVLTTPKEVTIVDSNIIIEPDEFIVVSRDSSIYEYHLHIPSKLLISNFATLNNSEDGLVIKDATGRTIDSVYFSNSIGGGNGFSLERIDLNIPSNNNENWASSTDIEKSTPGRINSVVPKDFDLSIKEIFYDPAFPTLNDVVTPSVKVVNNGKQDANNFSVLFSIQKSAGIESLDIITGVSLNSSDSLIVTSANSFTLDQNTNVITEIEFEPDEEKLNNYSEDLLVPGFTPKSIIITEFMSQPNNDETEWIELLNISNEAINILDWSVSDILSSPTKNKITESDILISPNEYFIIASDTSAFPYTIEGKIFEVNFGTLGNTEDGIILYDFRNAIIDSLFYDRTWNILRGQSTEKLSLTNLFNSSSNWSATLNNNGGTPGLINSATNIGEFEKESIVFNELMFEVSSGNSEFIELINVSDSSINIGGWKIEDETGNTNTLSTTNKLIEPNTFFVLAADTTILNNFFFDSDGNLTILNKNDLGLSNSGEILMLKDIRGNIIDSVNYSDHWHNKNFNDTKDISLERINPSIDSNDPMNWSSSVNSLGATPLLKNSIFTQLGDLKSDLSVDPNPFSPDNDGFEDFTIINYNLKKETSQIRIKIFDDKGRKVRTLVNNQPSGSSGSIIFDGLDDDGRALRIGMYIVFLEAIGNNSSVVETQKKVVVVARKL
jgi:hypothetical protein